MKRHTPSLLALAVLCLALVGCGGESSSIQGTLLENGQPLKLKTGEEIQMSVEPMTPGPPAKPLDVKAEDGSFKLTESLPAGKYRVVVRVNPYGQSSKDRYKGVFLSGKSPLQIELGGDQQNLEIDLVKKTIAKK